MNALAQIVGPTTLAATDVDLLQALKYARAEKAPATRRAYRSDFAAFQSWCQGKGLSGFPAEPETIAAYLASEAERGVKASTIGRRVAAIRHAHKLAGHEPPTNSEVVKATVRGIRRSIGAAKTRKAPIVAEVARAMAQAAPASLKGLRDRALLLLGFGGAFRRSEGSERRIRTRERDNARSGAVPGTSGRGRTNDCAAYERPNLAARESASLPRKADEEVVGLWAFEITHGGGPGDAIGTSAPGRGSDAAARY
jgi:site-specific recombinase XerC